MDRDLLRQTLSHHGQSLFTHLKCEQSENPDFKAIEPDLSKASYQRSFKWTTQTVLKPHLFESKCRLIELNTVNCKFPDRCTDNVKTIIYRKYGGEDNALVEQFIARKADILFAPSWKSSALMEDVLEEEGEGNVTVKFRGKPTYCLECGLTTVSFS